jgi:hypothetical protein
MKKLAAAYAALQLLLASGPSLAPAVAAQTISNVGQTSVNGCTGSCTVQPGNFIGTYTVATLPACNGTTTQYGYVAYVTDLGGGANTAKCVAGYWQHFTLGAPVTITSTASMTITPLSSAPIMILNNGALTVTQTLTLSTSNLYPGYILYVKKVGALGLLGSIGVTLLGSGVTLPVLGSSTSIFVYDGTTLQQIQ